MSEYLMRFTDALVGVMGKFITSSLKHGMRGLTCNVKLASNATER
jgi:hypothetical protein